MEDDSEVFVLVSLRAGLMTFTDSGHLQADPQKGLLSIGKGEDMLVHVLWQPRVGADAAGPPVHDVVVFPGECELKQIIGQARCYVLEFKEDQARNMFFWLQQPKASEDSALVELFNQAVNGMEVDPPQEQPQQQQQMQQTQAQPRAAAGNASDMAALLRGFLSANPPSTTDSTGQVNPNALAASLLAQMVQAGGGGKGGLRAQQQVDQGPGLHEVLRPDLLVPLLSRPGMLEKLAPHLPEEHRNLEQLVATIRSPQFQQQVATFSGAMQTGQLDLQQFGLQPNGYSVADFLESVQEMVDKEKQPGAGSEAK